LGEYRPELRLQKHTVGGLNQLDLEKYSSKHVIDKFYSCLDQAVRSEWRRVERREVSEQTARYFELRCEKYLRPYFGEYAPDEVRHAHTVAFVDTLTDQGLHPATIRQILVALKKVLNWALLHGHISGLPVLPTVRSQSTPRGGFTPKEVLRLWHTARRLANPKFFPVERDHRETSGGVFSKKRPIAAEMRWLIAIMVNGFMRPTDLRNIQHKHVELVRGRHVYLRLTLPESKGHTETIITLRPAVRAYEALKTHARENQRDGPDDYLFLPELTDRKKAMMAMGHQFRRILDQADLREGKRGQMRSIYSLRHTAITFRLIYGQGIDLLTLAKNARTSVGMVEQFYASELSAELNVAMLQSRRSVRKVSI
jgi:site-specific recombinase XerD